MPSATHDQRPDPSHFLDTGHREALGQVERELRAVLEAGGLASEYEVSGEELALPSAVADAARYLTRTGIRISAVHGGDRECGRAGSSRRARCAGSSPTTASAPPPPRTPDAGCEGARARPTLGGTLTVSSAPGWGARVVAELALDVPTPGEDLMREAAPTGRAGGRRKLRAVGRACGAGRRPEGSRPRRWRRGARSASRDAAHLGRRRRSAGGTQPHAARQVQGSRSGREPNG